MSPMTDPSNDRSGVVILWLFAVAIVVVFVAVVVALASRPGGLR